MKQRILFFLMSLIIIPLQAQEQVITLDLSHPLEPAILDFNAEKGYWTESYSNAPLVFPHFTFDHSGGYYGDMGYWSGFTVSLSGDSLDHGSPNSTLKDGWLTFSWGNMAGGGIKTDADGAVVKDTDGKIVSEKGIPYLIGYDAAKITFDASYDAVGVYLNNHPWPYYSNLYGDDYARALNREGDYFKVIFHGLNAEEEETGTVEYRLAEYKAGRLEQSRDWQWVDLSSLGRIKRLSMTFESTDVGQWGMNTSTYYCLDKLQLRTSVTGIQSPDRMAIKVYPGSVSDRLFVESASKIDRLIISDIHGRIVYQKTFRGDFRIEIPVSGWNQGVYILKTTSGQRESIQKFIKK
jgi:hypothetical protein